jgi:DNA helicase HerA-like ATPase
MSDITFFAKTNFRNQETVFGIKTDDRRRHIYVIGKTGMGKTNLLENMVIQDIQNGHGVAFVDAHGDSAEKLIKSIPSNRINDVIYFNPADQDYPIAFNVMEKVDPEYRHLIASGLVGVFKKIWADSWGPRLEYILRNAILGLL